MVVGTIKVLILGAGGMLGQDLCKVFPEAFKLTHKDFDITNREEVRNVIEKMKPEIVINAAACTGVEACEDNRELAFQVNGYGPGYIAEACSGTGASLVHFSTDYVFDGNKKEYTESDFPNPINAYGESKLLGEKKIIEKTENYRIVRTSWLFGIEGENFVELMLRLSGEVDTVKVVADQFGKPTYSLDLAEKTKEIVRLEPGIYHVTNEGICSWYEFASAVIENVVPCTSVEFPRKAKRPKYSVLRNTKISLMRHWHEALEAYLREKKGD